MYALFRQLHRFSLRHPIIVLLLWLIPVALMSPTVPKIKLDGSYQIYFHENEPMLKTLDGIHEQFSNTETVTFMVKSRHGDVFNTQSLAAIEALTAKAWELPHAVRVDSLSNFPYSYSVDDDLHVAELVEQAENFSSDELEKVRSQATQEPLLTKRLLSKDYQAAMVVVSFDDVPAQSTTVNRQLYSAALALRDEMAALHPEQGIHVSGILAFGGAATETAVSDAQSLTPVALFLALIVIVCYLWFESGSLLTAVAGAIAAIAVIIVSILIPLAILSATGFTLNNTSVIAPIVILTLAVADSVHILIRYFHNLSGRNSEQALPKTQAMQESLSFNAEAVWLTSLTTIIGFLALLKSGTPPFEHLGAIVACGVFIAWLASNSLLPACIQLMPAQASDKKQRDAKNEQPVANWVIRYQNGIITVGITCLLLGIVGVPQNRINDQLSKYLTQSTDFGKDSAETLQHFGDFADLIYHLESGQGNGIYEEAFLGQLGTFTDWLRTQPGVKYVQSIDLTLRRLNKNMHGDDGNFYRMPANSEEAAQYLLLYELSLPYGASLTNEVNLDKSGVRVVVGLEQGDTQTHLAMQEKIQHWLRDNMPEHAQPGTSSTTMMANMVVNTTISMFWSTLMILLMIGATIAIVFRSLAYGLISILVNAMPALMALGLWGFFIGEAGFSISVVFALSLGIVVDYSVHFMSKYRRSKREKKLDTEQAIRYAYSTVGIALVVTTAVLCINFGILGLSDFRLNAHMGLLTTITILLAVATQLIFLPALLMALGKKQLLDWRSWG